MAADPFRRLLDLVVYAPIGLLTVAKAELPQLIATGKTRLDNQLTVAKFVGKMAVNQGKQEVERRLDAAERARNASPVQPSSTTATNGVGDPDVDDLDVDDLDVDDLDVDDLDVDDLDLATASLPAAVIELVAESPLLDDAAAALPIAGYDSLAASQVVGRLGSLTAAELDSVERYETSHRARRTILGKINQLRAG
jgi:hypothetical protein